MRDKKLILGQSNEFYDKFARACSDNAFGLMSDANDLFFHKKYSTAFAFGVISAEEYSKALLFKAVSTGIVKLETLLSKDGRYFEPFDHVAKQKGIRDFISGSLMLQDQIPIIARAVVSGKSIPELSLDKKKAQKVIALFEKIEDLKQDSLYVGFDGKDIIIPSKTITEKMCLELLDTLLEGLPSIDNFVNANNTLMQIIVGQIPKSEETDSNQTI